MKSIRSNHFDHAVQSLLDGADIGIAFLPELGGPLYNIVDFMWHLWRTNMFLLYLVLQRLAFVTGASWILELRDVFLRHTSPACHVSTRKRSESHLECIWRSAVRSGIFTSNRRRTEKPSLARSALYYACIARSESVVTYLLHVGHRIGDSEDAAFALSQSISILRLLTEKSTFRLSTMSLAMQRVFQRSFSRYGSLKLLPSPDRSHSEQPEAILLIGNILSHVADVSMTILREGRRYPLLHCAIYTEKPFRLDLIRLILDQGANTDATGLVPWHDSSSITRVSALALAALIPLTDVLNLLVARGFCWIWSDDLDLQRLAEKNFKEFFKCAMMGNQPKGLQKASRHVLAAGDA
jgi:hypothetical protein